MTRLFSSSWTRGFVLLVYLIALPSTLFAPPPPPTWWVQRGVLDRTKAADDTAAANIGQLKQMASKAYEEFQAKLPNGGAETPLSNLVLPWSLPPVPPLTRDDSAALTLGQLKYVAKPFYDRLSASHLPAPFPWHVHPDDSAVANLGQLKEVFSFSIEHLRTVDANGNGLPDWWEHTVLHTPPGSGNIFTNPPQNPASPGTQSPSEGPDPHNDIVPNQIFPPGTRFSEAPPAPRISIVGYPYGAAPPPIVDGTRVAVKGSSERFPGKPAPTSFNIYRRKNSNGLPPPNDAAYQWALLGSVDPSDVFLDHVDFLFKETNAWVLFGGTAEFCATAVYNGHESSPSEVVIYAPQLGYWMRDLWGRTIGDSPHPGTNIMFVEVNPITGATPHEEIELTPVKPRPKIATECLNHLTVNTAAPLRTNPLTIAAAYWEGKLTSLSGNVSNGCDVSISKYSVTPVAGYNSTGGWREVFVPLKLEKRPHGPLLGPIYHIFHQPQTLIPKSWDHGVDPNVETDNVLKGIDKWEDGSAPDEHDYGNGSYWLIGAPNLQFTGRGIDTALNTAAKQNTGVGITSDSPLHLHLVVPGLMTVPGTMFDTGWSGDPLTVTCKFTWDTLVLEAGYWQTLYNEDVVWVAIQPNEEIPFLFLQKLEFRLKPGLAVDSTSSVSVSVFVEGKSIGSDSMTVSSTRPLEDIIMPMDEASGADYRKIALNGRPLKDGRPQAKGETDGTAEETFVDALTLGLRHSTTDVYLDVPGADFSVSCRRNSTSEVWTTRRGLRPHERPDRPFGIGWTTNLAPSLEVVIRGNEVTEINVTDLDGNVRQFIEGAYGYYPMPTGKNESNNSTETLFTNFSEWFFHSRNGATLVFERAGIDSGDTKLQRVISSDREKGGTATVTHKYYRLKYAEDRAENRLVYDYDDGDDATLVPTSIHTKGPDTAPGVPGAYPGMKMWISQNQKGLITDVWDATGHYHYNYQERLCPPAAGGAYQLADPYYTEWTLESIDLPDPAHLARINYQWNLLEEPPLDEPMESQPQTPDRFWHVDLKQITDPNGHATLINYAFDTTKTCYSFTKQRYFQQTGRPRIVTKVITPAGEALFETLPPETIKIHYDGTQGKFVVSNNPARYSKVTDAEGKIATYQFGEAEVLSLVRPDTNFSVRPEAAPKLVCYQKMELKLGTHAASVYRFDLDADLALKSVKDFSGNTTTYYYDDSWQNVHVWPDINAGYAKAFQNFFGHQSYRSHFTQPTHQENALGLTKTFTYKTTTVNGVPVRNLKGIVDESNRVTLYEMDEKGRTISEAHKRTNGSMESKTVFEYTDGRAPGVVTRQTVKNAPAGGADPADLVTDYELDAMGHVLEQTLDPDAGGLQITTQHSYDANGNRLSTIDPNNHLIGFTYDARNRLVKVEYPGPFTKTFEYDARGNKKKEKDENGIETTFAYDDSNRLLAVHRAGTSTFNTYNNVGSRLSVTDPNGHTTDYRYDDFQRLTKTIDPLNRETLFDYGNNSGGDVFDGASFKPVKITDPKGTATDFIYDKLYRQTSKTVQYDNGQSAAWLTEYDEVGNVTVETDPLSKETTREYDSRNLLTELTFHDGTSQQFFHTATGLRYQVIDEMQKATVTSFDHAGRPVKVTGPSVQDKDGQPQQPETKTEYDNTGNVISITDPTQKTVTFGYDFRGRKIAETRPGSTTRYAYDGVGNQTASMDPRGNVCVKEYDALNRVRTVLLPDGATLSSTYDDAGNVLSATDGNGNTTSNTYDFLNRLLTTTDAGEIKTTYEYDEVGNRTSVKDGLQQKTSFSYDGLHRVKGITDLAGNSTTFTYDGVNKVSRTDALGNTNYGYDDRHRLKTVTYANGPAPDREYDYDPAGRVTSVTEAGKNNKTDVSYSYDALGQVTSETSGGLTHVYTYDLAGNRAKATYGANGLVVNYEYDDQHRLQTLTEGTRATTYVHDANGNVTLKSLPNGDRVFSTFDPMNRVLSIVGTSPANAAHPEDLTLYRYDANYDFVGNVIGIDEEYGDGNTGTLRGRRLGMTYDLSDRLVTETVAQDGVTTTAYQYDRAGNRISRTVSSQGAGNEITGYHYNELNQLTSTDGPSAATFTYDFNGNRQTVTRGAQVETYNYDRENRLVHYEVTNGPPGNSSYDYTYDYRSRRVEVAPAGNPETKVVFSGGTSVVEFEGGAKTVEYMRGSDHGGGVGGILYSLRSGLPSYTHYDARGDVTAKTDGGGGILWQASYEAFGKRTQEEGATLDRQKANTKDEDPTGLLNEGMRYRDLETGTFLTRDPAGFVDGPNLYAYVRQNPWSKFDPDGLFLAESGGAAIITIAETAGPSAVAYTGIGALAIGAGVGGYYLGKHLDARTNQPINGGVHVPHGSTDCNSGVTNSGKPEQGLIMPQQTQGDREAYSRFLATGNRRELDDYLGQRSRGGNPSGKTAKDTVEDNQKKVPNPDGSKGKPDHQAKVDELEAKARAEAGEGETVLRERKIQGQDSNRRPDVQIVDEEGKARKVFEAERRPESSRNQKREAEYERLKLEQETHKVGGNKK